MAKATVKSQPTQEETFNPIVLDEIIETKDGIKLRMVVDITKIRNDSSSYARGLKRARRIPRLETINMFDSKASEAIDKLKEVGIEKPDSEQVLEMLREYYENQSTRIEQEDSIMLAMFTHNDNREILNIAPKPVEDEVLETLPGIIELSEPVKNLFDPAERRLKRLWDIISSDPVVILRWQTLFNQAAMKMQLMAKQIQQEANPTNDAGFQPSGANRAVSS